MRIYVMIVDGVYRHEILGYRSELDRAKERARELLSDPRVSFGPEDVYHHVSIVAVDHDGEQVIGSWHRTRVGDDTKPIPHPSHITEPTWTDGGEVR